MSSVKIKLLFYNDNGSSKSDRLVYSMIKKWTNGPYYHVEMTIDGMVVKSDRNGVSIGRGDDVGSYDVVELELPVTPQQKDVLDRWVRSVDNAMYDYVGILFSQIISSRYDDPDKWFCSELVVKALQILCYEPAIYLTPNMVSPNGLYKVLKDNGDVNE